MTKYFKVEKLSETDGVVEVKVGFGEPAQMPQILPDAVAAVKSLKLTGGKLLKFNGPCAVPVAMALAHEVAHLYAAVAFFVPMEAAYVVCISHDPELAIGQYVK